MIGTIATTETEDGAVTDDKTITINIVREAEDIPLPRYATSGSSGLDIHANETVTIPPRGVAMIATGIKVSIPEGYEIQIRSRSGFAAKHGLFVLNSPGTIDADYRGEIKVIMANFSDIPFTVHRLDRIAQMVPAQVTKAECAVTEALSDTKRGTGGFGHSGR